MNNKIILTLLLIPFSTGVLGQDNLSRYIEIGLKNNRELLLNQLDIQLAEENLRQSRGQFMANIFLDASYTWSKGGRTINIPAGDLINPAYKGLNQIMGESIYPTNIPNYNEQLLPNNFHETKIRLIQPLLNNKIYYQYRAQQAMVSVSEAKLKAYENQLIKEIKVAYYHHLASHEQVLLHKNIYNLFEEFLNRNRALVANNKATENIIYDVQSELAQTNAEIASAIKQENTTRYFFNYLIGRELNSPILVDSVHFLIQNDININDLMLNASGTRPELSQLNNQILANNEKVNLYYSFIFPEINLIGDIGYQGFEYKFNSDQHFWFLQLSLKWPIFSGFQNISRIRQAKLVERQLNLKMEELQQQISIQINKAYFEYIQSLEILKARKEALNFISISYRISEKHYKQGLILPVEFHEARLKYNSALQKEIIARYNLKIKEAELETASNLTIE